MDKRPISTKSQDRARLKELRTDLKYAVGRQRSFGPSFANAATQADLIIQIDALRLKIRRSRSAAKGTT